VQGVRFRWRRSACGWWPCARCARAARSSPARAIPYSAGAARVQPGAQAQAVAGALCGETQDKIASSLPGKITRQAVSKHLDAAHWEAVEAALAALENEFGKAYGNL